eukprot:scaffold5737_cov112-Isochrysis_galbana.AAC.3
MRCRVGITLLCAVATASAYVPCTSTPRPWVMRGAAPSHVPILKERGAEGDARTAGGRATLIVAVAGAALAAFIALAVGGLAAGLGWDIDPATTADNRGIGVPLSVAESSELRRGGNKDAAGGGAPEVNGEVLSIEELREEQAVLNIIYGLDNRAR